MAGQSAEWIATARVLRRAGFGVTGPEVDAVVSQDWTSYVDAMLAANPDAPAAPPPPRDRAGRPRHSDAIPGRTARAGQARDTGGPQAVQPADIRATGRVGRLVAKPHGQRQTAGAREANPAVAQPLRHLRPQGPGGGVHGRTKSEAAHPFAG